jgi:AcrR family transcriptional regulator
VAKEAGLSAGIVIFHFTSKDELLAAIGETGQSATDGG